jgi:hypothetical protein
MTSSSRTHAFDERWGGLVGAYGGWVAAVLADESALDGYRLRSLQIRFQSGVAEAPMTLVTTSLHRGRRSASTRVTLEQDGRVRAEAVGIHLNHSGLPDVIHTDQPRDSPPSTHRSRAHAQGDIAYAKNLEVLTPESFTVETGSSGWLRLGAPPAELGIRSGAAVACALLDALLPVSFADEDPPAFVPTLEFGYAFTPAVDDLADDWCVGENRLDWLDGEFCAEEGTLVAASDGRLLARQRQLRSIRRTIPADAAPTTPQGAS